jgi:hypothetical protein
VPIFSCKVSVVIVIDKVGRWYVCWLPPQASWQPKRLPTLKPKVQILFEDQVRPGWSLALPFSASPNHYKTLQIFGNSSLRTTATQTLHLLFPLENGNTIHIVFWWVATTNCEGKKQGLADSRSSWQTAVIATIVQSFFVYRYWKLTKRWYICIVILMGMLLSIVAACLVVSLSLLKCHLSISCHL